MRMSWIMLVVVLASGCSIPTSPTTAQRDDAHATAHATIADLGLIGWTCGNKVCQFLGQAKNIGSAVAVSVTGEIAFGGYAPISVAIQPTISAGEVVTFTGSVPQDERGLPGLPSRTVFTWKAGIQ